MTGEGSHRPLVARAVLFDIDGTLIDSVPAYIEVARVAASALGLETDAAQVRSALASGSSFWKDVVSPDRGDAQEVLKALSREAARHWPGLLRSHARMFEDTAETLAELVGRGLRLGIVSGARPEVLELLRAQNLLNLFEVVLLGADIPSRKPDPQGILMGLERLSVAPQEAAYVGDAPIDIQAGHAAGVHAIGVLTGAGDRAMLMAEGPDGLIPSLAHLPALLS